MKLKKVIVTTVLLIIGFFAHEMRGGEVETNQPPELEAVPKLFGDWGGLRSGLATRGLEVDLSYIVGAVGNVSGGLRRGVVAEGLVGLGLTVDTEKAFGWAGGRWHASGLYPHGPSLSKRYTGDNFILSNLDASDDVRLFELWLEQQCGDFSLRVGQLAADQEFAGTDRGSLFGNSACGWLPIISANAPAPAYPQGILGARLAWQPSANWLLQFGAFDGDPNPYDGNGRQTNPHGLDLTLNEGVLTIAEATFRWPGATNSPVRPGCLKFGFWYHSGRFDDLRTDDTGLSLADPLSSGRPRRLSGNWGGYLAGEQQLWTEPADAAQGLGCFGRLGLAADPRSPLELYAELGFTYVGLLPRRAEDIFGVACMYGQSCGELRRLVQEGNAFNGTSDPLPDFEVVVESAYAIALRPGWVLKPSLQYIIHPGGSAAIPNALVLGVRTEFAF